MDGSKNPVKVPRKLLVCLLGGDEPRRNAARARVVRKVTVVVTGSAEHGQDAHATPQKTNADAYLTGAPHGVCVPTRDLFDRAHVARGADGKLRAAATGGTRGKPVKSAVANARPRMYPASSMTSRGVAFDSAYDETYQRQQALSGVADGIGGRAMTMAEARYVALARMGSERSVRSLARWEGRGNTDDDD